MNETLTKGRARLHVSDSLVRMVDNTIERPKVGAVIWDAMEFQALVEKWRPLVMLPDGYEIIGIFFDVALLQWTIVVESEKIPLPKPYETLPLMAALYQRGEDGIVSLVDLRLIK